MAETIYSERDAFFLEIQGVDFKIREPVLWGKVKTAMERDPIKHGIDINFPSKDSLLEFSDVPEDDTGNRSKSLIDAEALAKGSDANILLKFGTWDGVTLTTITMQKLELGKGYVNKLHVSILKATHISDKKRILDYYDARIRLEDTQDVLGDPLPALLSPLATEDLNMHSQVLIKNIHKENPNESIFNGDEFDINDPQFNVRDYFLQYGFNEKIAFDGMDDFNLPNGLSGIHPVIALRANFQTIDSGTLFLTFLVTKAIVKFVAPVNRTFTSETVLQIGTSSKRQKFTLSFIAGNITGDPQQQSITLGETRVTELVINYIKPGDLVWIYTVLQFDQTVIIDEIQFSQDNFILPPDPFSRAFMQQIQFRFETYESASVNKAYRLRDAIEYALLVITGEDGHFKSDIFFGDLGAGFDFHLINGYLQRSIDMPNRKPAFTMKEAFEAANMMWLIGENIEVDDNGVVTVVWEEVEHFYQDHEILDLTEETDSFEIVSNEELSINLTKYSYPRLSVRETDGGGSLAAVNTELESSLPLETGIKKYSKRTKWRTEGYDIENSRRTSIVDAESVNTDEDIFIINSLNEYTFTSFVAFHVTDNEIEFPEGLFEQFRRASRLAITGSASNNITITFDIVNVRETGAKLFLPVNENLVEEGNTLVTLTAIGSASKKDEDFDKTVFVTEEEITFNEIETVKNDLYNMILQPARVMIQHGKWTNGSVLLKLQTLFYKTLKHLNSDNFRTQLKPALPHEYGDRNRIEFMPKDNVAIEDAHNGKSLLTGRKFRLKGEISRERFALIDAAMRGQGPTPYGYISTLNNDGNKVSGYLLTLSGDPDINYYDNIILAEKGNFYT